MTKESAGIVALVALTVALVVMIETLSPSMDEVCRFKAIMQVLEMTCGH